MPLLSPKYEKADPTVMLSDVVLSEPLTKQQAALIKQADVLGALSQVTEARVCSAGECEGECECRREQAI